MLEFDRKFHGVTVVDGERGQARVYDQAGQLETVSLEDPDFEKAFEVTSTDQVEARFLLSPEFMQRLVELRNVRAGSGLRCSFIDRKLHIAIPSAFGLFEMTGTGKPAGDTDDVKKVLRQMHNILEIVDILKLKDSAQ